MMKSFKKKLLALGLALGALLVLTGCIATQVSNGIRVPTEAAKQGLTYRILVLPMSWFVDLFAHNPAIGYGWAIIIVTLIIRLFILPLGLRQAYKMTYNQEKMAYLKPVFDPINVRMKKAREARDNQAMMAAQQELMKAQKDNGVSMFSLSNMGCLPMIIQWPFFVALYNAAAYTPGIASASFYGMPLGKSSLILTLIAGVFYLGQSWISTIGMPPEQKKQSQLMLFISPLSIVFFSFISPAGVTLYWVAGGLVIVIQQAIITFLMKPRMRRQIDQEFKENPPKMSDLPKDVTPTEAVTEDEAAIEAPKPEKKANRNAGRQQRNK